MQVQARTKRLATLAMLSALAYLAMVVGRVPVVLFLKYDPKDVITVIAGFLYGPIASLTVSVVVSFVEMLTVSDTWIIGFIMNVLSTSAFACTASAIYKRRHTLGGAVTGLFFGGLAMCVTMLLWNYIITPLYMNAPREVVAGMLMTVFLPFNLLKAGLNSAITLIIYRPLKLGLLKSGLMPQSSGEMVSGKVNVWVLLAALFVIISCVLIILANQGII